MASPPVIVIKLKVRLRRETLCIVWLTTAMNAAGVLSLYLTGEPAACAIMALVSWLVMLLVVATSTEYEEKQCTSTTVDRKMYISPNVRKLLERFEIEREIRNL